MVETNQSFQAATERSVAEVYREALTHVSHMQDINPVGPKTDKLQNSAQSSEWGKGFNAWSHNHPEIPSVEGGPGQYKGAALFEARENPAKAVAEVVDNALWECEASYAKMTGFDVKPEYVRGAAATVTEKFAFLMRGVENAVKDVLLSKTDLEEWTVTKPVEEREPAGEDVILSENGERVTFQVKTGRNQETKDADYLVEAKVSIESKEFEFTVKKA